MRIKVAFCLFALKNSSVSPMGKEHLPNIEGMFCIQSMTLKDLQHYLSTGGTIWMSMVKGRQ